jgi:hypothetical protein
VLEEPPAGFDEAFFAWLARMSEGLSIDFASRGSLPAATGELERRLGLPPPEDLRRFDARFTPWGVLRDWFGWDETVRQVRQASGGRAPLLPVDLEDVFDGGLLVRQSHLADLHLLLVFQAQLAPRVLVQDDAVSLPDEQRIAAAFILDALLRGQQLATRL